MAPHGLRVLVCFNFMLPFYLCVFSLRFHGWIGDHDISAHFFIRGGGGGEGQTINALKPLTLYLLVSSADDLCNSLDPDQDRQIVGPDLDPNGLTH